MEHEKQFYLSADLAPRLAAIDIGTNSLRLIIAEALRDGKYRVLDDEKEATRLGAGLETTGRLDPEAVQRSLDALRRMVQIAAGYQVRQLRAIATCAVREAADGPEFCRRVQDETGLAIEVVSARTEAQLAFTSVARNFDLQGKNVAVVDIGGGSTEIVLASGNIVEEIYTTPLGAVRVSERFGGQPALSVEAFAELISGTDRLLRKHSRKPLFCPHLMVGCGGTFTALATMVMALKGQAGLPVRGYSVARADVRHLLDRLRKLSPKARRGVAGLSPDRADIIVGGLAVIDSLMRRLGVNFVQVHDGGVRDGLLLTMAKPDAPPSSETPDAAAAIDQFAERCGVDLVHGQHVARLAGSIYAQLCGPWGMDPADQLLLEQSAKLQDVGYLINYEQHHKHSYHMIMNSHLPGMTPHDLELIANVARYHRGARPKKKHANFKALSKPDQQRVKRLAAILRLAGGFDRSHSQQVTDVNVEFRDGAIRLLAVASTLPEVDLWGAQKRVAIFERVFACQAAIVWQGAVPETTEDTCAQTPSTTSPAERDARPGAARCATRKRDSQRKDRRDPRGRKLPASARSQKSGE